MSQCISLHPPNLMPPKSAFHWFLVNVCLPTGAFTTLCVCWEVLSLGGRGGGYELYFSNQAMLITEG